MQICKNCHQQNEDNTDTCVHCRMKGRLVPWDGKTNKTKKNVKNLYRTCQNCGTVDPGNGERCTHCHFPLPEMKTTRDKDGSDRNFIKQQQN